VWWVCILLAFQRHLTMYLKEMIHLTDPRTAKWRFMFFRVALSIKKESAPLNFISTNILNHVTKDELRGVRIAKTSFRLFVKMKKWLVNVQTVKNNKTLSKRLLFEFGMAETGINKKLQTGIITITAILTYLLCESGIIGAIPSV